MGEGSAFFQTLEKSRSDFPMLGNLAGGILWLNCFFHHLDSAGSGSIPVVKYFQLYLDSDMGRDTVLFPMDS